jgi:hypothetical protein
VWAEIDTHALQYNYKLLCSLTPGTRHICAVKADAYGHVADICVPVLCEAGCDFFAVSCIEEAITHINKYNTKHSEAIITRNDANAEKFLNEVDSACVYWNVSTRFSDGNEFGFGAEIGISTQKLHARGPMGLEALTSYKYVIYGGGQVRG